MSKTDKDRPFTWVRYKEGLCNACHAACCTMPVEVKASDLVRLGLANEDEINDSPKKVFTKLSRKGILRSYRASTGLFMLVQKTNSDCIFLDKNRLCTVYLQRPDVCRQFPTIGLRPGYCPAQHSNEK